MEYQADPNIANCMKMRLSKIFNCPIGEVSEIKAYLITKWLEGHNGVSSEDTDVAEYHVVMDIADRAGDHELARLMHLYRVGYFVQDTIRYQPKQGEEYEIVNSNYIYAISKLNGIGSRAA